MQVMGGLFVVGFPAVVHEVVNNLILVDVEFIRVGCCCCKDGFIWWYMFFDVLEHGVDGYVALFIVVVGECCSGNDSECYDEYANDGCYFFLVIVKIV